MYNVDFLGRTLKVNDKVVYLSHSRTSSKYVKAVVNGFAPKKVYIKLDGDKSSSNKCVEAYKLIKYEE